MLDSHDNKVGDIVCLSRICQNLLTNLTKDSISRQGSEDDGFILVARQELEEEMDIEYEVISLDECSTYYNERGEASPQPDVECGISAFPGSIEPHNILDEPSESRKDPAHCEWVGKLPLLRQDRIALQLGPERVYRELLFGEIPRTSKLLAEVRSRPFSDRHIWLPQIDVTMIQMYCLLKNMEKLARAGTWLNVFELAYTARTLQDEHVYIQAIGCLSRKATLCSFKADRMFTRQDIDWVYEHTQEGDPLRGVTVSLAVAVDGLLAEIHGPEDFILDTMEACLENEENNGSETLMQSKPMLSPRSLRPPTAHAGHAASSERTAKPDVRDSKSVLRGKLKAGEAKANTEKVQPKRQPVVPPSTDDLLKDGRRNFERFSN